MNSIDDVIAVYKRDVDVTLLEASLQLTVEERLLRLEEFERFREEMQVAVKQARRDQVR